MNFRIYKCVISFKFNQLTYTVIAKDDDEATSIVKGYLDRDTIDELERGELSIKLSSYPIASGFVAMETSLVMR